MKWNVYKYWQSLDIFPHDIVKIKKVSWCKNSLIARWTEDFDCKEKTEFWYCVLDKPFELNKIRAKERYEINKGNKYFYTKCINPAEFSDDMYDVYVDSMTGYMIDHVKTRDEYEKSFHPCMLVKERIEFGVFDKATNCLCGYADIYARHPYIPISAFKTRVTHEKQKENFALMYGIVQYFDEDIKNGSYLCDGTRNIFHQTNFQAWLERYFNFRKAYCHLHVVFRKPFNIIFIMMYPFRGFLKKKNNKFLRELYSALKLFAWSKGEKE